MTLKNDAEQFVAQEKRLEPREGDPKGTHFVVISLIVLLVLVGIYFVGATVTSQTPTANATQEEVTSTPSSQETPPAK